MYLLPESWRMGLQPESVGYCDHGCKSLRPCHPEEEAAEWPWRGTASRGSGDWAIPGVEGHSQSQSRLQELLGPMDVPSNKRWCSYTPLGVDYWTYIIQTGLPWIWVKEVVAELQGGSLGGHLGVDKILNKIDSGSTGYRPAVTLKYGADSVMFVQPCGAPKPITGAWCTTMKSEHHFTGWP
jgi:hypothetical protein